MTYELAKELKDAGFPQTGFIGGHFYSKDGIRWQSSIERSELTYGDIKEPTLEELIEACRDERDNELLRLIQVPKEPREITGEIVWGASRTDQEYYHGSTPTEAVAKLWLALNAK